MPLPFEPACMPLLLGALPHRGASQALEVSRRFAGGLLAWPQLPQFPASVDVSTQLPLQHVSSPAQRWPQSPQFASSVFVSTHAWPQSVFGDPQPVAHVPPAQPCPLAQAWPHWPQFAGSELRLRHFLPHLVVPFLHFFFLAGATP